MKFHIYDYASIGGIISSIVANTSTEIISQYTAIYTGIVCAIIATISLTFKIIAIVKKLRKGEITEEQAAEEIEKLNPKNKN